MTNVPASHADTGPAMSGFKIFLQPKTALMFVLGFSAGLPFLLYFSVLSVRLEQSGTDTVLIGFFSWFGLSYSLKFLWAPLIEQIRPPGMTGVFGQRASWIFIAQIGVACGLVGMGLADPVRSLGTLALFSFLTAFASATQDIGVDAWRIEAAAGDQEQVPLAAAYQYGYRLAMMVSGGVALIFAGIANWTLAYIGMAVLILVAATILLIRSGGKQDRPDLLPRLGLIGMGIGFAFVLFSCVTLIALGIGYGVPRLFTAMGIEVTKSDIGRLATYLAALPFLISALALPWIRSLPAGHKHLTSPVTGPVLDVFWRYGWWALGLLAFITSYRLSDIVMGVMAKASYSHIGYSATEIGAITGFIAGPWTPLIGVALAGLVTLRFGLIPALIAGSILSVLGNLTFVWLMGQSPDSTLPLLIAVTADNVAGGFAGTVFIAFLSKLTSRTFCASQYALFSSMFTLVPKLIAGTSGLIVMEHGYANFFLYAALLGVPAIILSVFADRFIDDRKAALA